MTSALAQYDLEPESVEVYINEIMADNDATIEDPDEAGAFEDWVELYNPGTNAVDLSGFYLTDDAEDPTQWRFPSGSTIDAGGYLIIWADDDSDQGDTHASFKLSAGGESVLLYNNDGETLVDSVTFGEQTTDVSYGRFPDGSSTLTVLSAATPGATNTNDATPDNVAPTAEAGGPYTGTVGGTITLSAATSTDSDGTIANYAWDLDNDGQYDDATGITAAFDAAAAGTFTVGLQVTDDDGATSTDTATVGATVDTPVVFINEIMADNDATIEDPDEAGAFEDWIELYNPGTSAVDLSGFYLTDDAADPTQWQFPAGSTVDAGGYLIIWADDDTDQGDDHASFKLSAGGESVVLYNFDGTTLVDSVTFGEQTTDVSYGRFPDGSSTLTVLSAATPGAANTNDTVENVAPTAEAGGPYTGTVGDTITLSGAVSTDSDGTVASYAWDLDIDGEYDDASGVTATFDAATAGTFTIGLQVTDDDGATSTDTATITVNDVANIDPTAEAGGPYSGTVGGTVTVSGAASTDSDGTIATYAWDLDNDGQYDDASGVTATFNETTAGTFTVGLQVTDDDGATSTDTATITVSAGLVISESDNSTTVNETGASDSFTIALASQPTADVIVSITSGDTGEVSVIGGTLTFTSDNWDTPQTVNVNGVADGITDGEQTASITIDPTSTDTNYQSLASSVVQVTNADFETPLVESRIFTPANVIRAHVIPGDGTPSAIIFQAESDATIVVVPIGTTDFNETVRILDGNVQQVSQYVDGVATANVTAGQLFAIIFQSNTDDRTYNVQSTAGEAAFSLSATTNILQRTDTNGDSKTTPLDALLVINELQNQRTEANGEVAPDKLLLDVSRNDEISPLDVLLVLNELSRQYELNKTGAQGELVAAFATSDFLPASATSSDPVRDEVFATESSLVTEEQAVTLSAATGLPDSASNASLIDAVFQSTEQEDDEDSGTLSRMDLFASSFLGLGG